MLRYPFLVGLSIALGACASAPPAPPPPAPAADSVRRAPAPPPEPAPTLSERRAAPFAVQHIGAPVRPAPVVVAVVPEPATPDSAPRPDSALAVAPPAARPDSARRPAAPAPPARAAAPPVRTHRLGAGETFLAVARRYSVTYDALRAANPGVEPNRVQAGQLLRLPAPARAPAAPAARAGARTHRVAPGETLWRISQRYGVSPARLRQLNRLQGDTVRAGQLLAIP